ncbi:hypothetical protein Bravens_01993 [Brevibacterium ravenspurgense]|uniref:Uncharacterized protein n=1 Tax=Brevibacterium ravenspurgense TaxID=479117 RepID=A0A150H5Y8_9MICO|nr:hypothetical protein [Brevibacterium ravenspurgense]KXZ57471.1 hypothetical protein Bravens_01993 [Brevibacterium ravenspurgense]
MTWLDLDPRAFADLPPDLVALLPAGVVPTLKEPDLGEPTDEVPVPGEGSGTSCVGGECADGGGSREGSPREPVDSAELAFAVAFASSPFVFSAYACGPPGMLVINAVFDPATAAVIVRQDSGELGADGVPADLGEAVRGRLLRGTFCDLGDLPQIFGDILAAGYSDGRFAVGALTPEGQPGHVFEHVEFTAADRPAATVAVLDAALAAAYEWVES